MPFQHHAFHEAISTKYPEAGRLHNQIVFELLINRLGKEAVLDPESWEDIQRVKQVLLEENLVWQDIELLLSSPEEAISTSHQDWETLPLSSALSSGVDAKAQNLDSLSEGASAYLRTEWALSPTLEIWLSRRLIFAEAAAFHRETHHLFSTNGAAFWWKMGKSLFRWVVGLFVALWMADYYKAPVGILTYVAWIALSRYVSEDRVKALALLGEVRGAMLNSYKISLRSDPAPIEMRDSLRIAEKHGAVWPSGLRALIEKASTRNPALWK